MHEGRWPVVPQPFADEAFGSWFGRVAMRYRMGVGELADQAQIKLDLGHECSGWLAAAPPRGASLRQLALLSHLAAKTLRAMPFGDSAAGKFYFCDPCFVLNDEDVTAPYWKSTWLQGQPGYCERHAVDWDHLCGSELSKKTNLRSLAQYVGERKVARADKAYEAARRAKYGR